MVKRFKAKVFVNSGEISSVQIISSDISGITVIIYGGNVARFSHSTFTAETTMAVGNFIDLADNETTLIFQAADGVLDALVYNSSSQQKDSYSFQIIIEVEAA